LPTPLRSPGRSSLPSLRSTAYPARQARDERAAERLDIYGLASSRGSRGAVTTVVKGSISDEL
jgi:hypothetical protein